MSQHALVSVYDKTNLGLLCETLEEHNINIISTGLTSLKIKDLGFKCIEISSLTGMKEVLGGRVKTLHHKIYTSILFNRNDSKHFSSFKKLQFPKIDFVIVNLYPFEKYKADKYEESKTIEMIDIGGPTLIRAASKNFNSISIIHNPSDYKKLKNNLSKNFGSTDLEFRKNMAKKAFKHTCEYDKKIFKWFSKQKEKKIKLKYGENPNQKSKLLYFGDKSLIDYQLQGKNISYNNILDINSGLDFLEEFSEPTAIIIKHNNACGAASSNKLKTALLRAIKSDHKSAFGGIVLLNRKVTFEMSKVILNRFFEIIVAPGFQKKALNNLSKKNKLILIDSNKISKKEKVTSRSIRGGLLIQNTDLTKINKNNFKTVSKNKNISKKEYEDIVFAFKIVKHLKSNAIVLVKNKQIIGIGAGQMNRFDATRIAIMKYKDNFTYKNFICASDAFFPFTDSLKILNKNKCRCIVQPSGSINDKDIINYSNKHNLKLVFSKIRVFKH